MVSYGVDEWTPCIPCIEVMPMTDAHHDHSMCLLQVAADAVNPGPIWPC